MHGFQFATANASTPHPDNGRERISLLSITAAERFARRIFERPKNPPVPVLSVAAVILDMDGVVTRTAKLHAAAWKGAVRRCRGRIAGYPLVICGQAKMPKTTSRRTLDVPAKQSRRFLATVGLHLSAADERGSFTTAGLR